MGTALEPEDTSKSCEDALARKSTILNRRRTVVLSIALKTMHIEVSEVRWNMSMGMYLYK